MVSLDKASSKYFNTARLMDEAFLDVLEKKDFEYITIKEICIKAGVNRSTFYLHYENTIDLLNETVEYIIDKFNSSFEQKPLNIVKFISDSEKEELCFINKKHLIPYLEFIKDNQKIFKLFLTKSDALGLHEVYDKLCFNIINPIMKRFKVEEKDIKYYTAYYINGIIAIVSKWVYTKCSDDVSYIAELIEKIVMNNVKI